MLIAREVHRVRVEVIKEVGKVVQELHAVSQPIMLVTVLVVIYRSSQDAIFILKLVKRL